MENRNLDEIQSENEFEQMLEASLTFTPLERGQIRTGTIQQVRHNEIIVDLGVKQDGIVPSQDIDRLDPDIRAELKVGEQVPVYVLNPYDADGNVIVSINMGLQKHDWDKAQELLTSQDVVEVNVVGHNRGGVLVRWNRLEGFIPTSHMVSVSPGLTGNDRRETLQDIVGQRLHVKVIEVEPNRRRLIFSEREAQKEWRVQQKARLLAELAEGQVIRGTVTGLRDFGAFVNLGGADGLIHVSELAWHRVDHPRDVLRIGEEIDVYVLNLDRETNRIALSRKRLLPDPWVSVMETYHEGQQVEGTVTNVVDFGAFIALDDGLEGLLHLSEMGDGTLKEPHSYVKKGDRLQLCISHLEPERRRVGFTQRWGVDLEGAEGGEGSEDIAEEDEEFPAEDFMEEEVPVDDIPAEGEDTGEIPAAEDTMEQDMQEDEGVAEGEDTGEIPAAEDAMEQDIPADDGEAESEDSEA